MSWLLRLIASLLIAFERLKGTRTIRVRVIQCTSSDAMQVLLNDQNDVIIFSDELVHTLHYSAWWAPNRRVSVFQVYGLCSPGMSEEDKARFQVRREIPAFHGKIWGKAWQKERAIEGYLDAIRAESQDSTRTDFAPL